MRNRIVLVVVAGLVASSQAHASCTADQRAVANAVVRNDPLPVSKPLLTQCGRGSLDSMVNGSWLGGLLTDISASFFDQLSATVCGNAPQVGGLPSLTGNGGLSFGNPYAGDVSGPDMTLGRSTMNADYARSTSGGGSSAQKRALITVPPPYSPGAAQQRPQPSPSPSGAKASGGQSP